jgi:hypothetical protein
MARNILASMGIPMTLTNQRLPAATEALNPRMALHGGRQTLLD